MGNAQSNGNFQRKYMWRPDLPDRRDVNLKFKDYFYSKSVDLRSECPPVYDQEDLGSCVDNGVCGAYHFDEMKQNNDDQFMPSRLFVYYNVRKDTTNIEEDTGSSVRAGVKSICNIGVCHEDIWPYDTDSFTDEPTEDCYEDAKNHMGLEYKRVKRSEKDLKQCLSDGFPVIFGFTVYSSFESPEVAETGIVPMPGPKEQVLGGHCVVLVGYSDDTKQWIVRNSWGTEWGDEGYCYFPYEYLTDSGLSSDYWMITSVSNNTSSLSPVKEEEEVVEEEEEKKYSKKELKEISKIAENLVDSIIDDTVKNIVDEQTGEELEEGLNSK
jgi:C1A family cysteine protease